MWQSDVWRNAADLLLIQQWKAATRKRDDCWMLVGKLGGGGSWSERGLRGHRNRATAGHSWSEFKRFATAIHCLCRRQTDITVITLYNNLKKIVSVKNMLLIYLFASMKL